MNSQPDADVVKRSYLRFKATKTGGPGGGLLGVCSVKCVAVHLMNMLHAVKLFGGYNLSCV